MPAFTHDWTQPYPRKKNWQHQAACKGHDINLFIPKDKEERQGKAVRYNKTICDTCPVQKDCLDYALANHPPIGLWAGTLPKDRDKMYPKYQGEREHDFDVSYLASHNNARRRNDLVPDEATATINGNLCDLLADNSSYHRYKRTFDPLEDYF